MIMINTHDRMTVWLTDYILTKGIYTRLVQVPAGTSLEIGTRLDAVGIWKWHWKLGKNAWLTYEEAAAEAERVRNRAVKSHLCAIERLKASSF